MVFTGEYKGVPYRVSAHKSGWCDKFEVCVWINMDGIGIADGMPCGHKTMLISPERWQEWKQQLERNQLPMKG